MSLFSHTRGFCLLFLPALLAAGTLSAQTGAPSAADLARAYEYLNELRERADMTVFATEIRLEQAAQNHSDYLAVNLRSGHGELASQPGYTGASSSERAARTGYHGQTGENVSTGRESVDNSIDGLMNAIYHRFGFLTFNHDELGIGIGSNSGRGFYTYNMGNAKVDKLCGSASSASSGYTNVCASNPSLVLSTDALFEARALVQGNNPEIVMWPVRGESDFPPAFFEESPDPLPDYSVSGAPISVQFNPLSYESVTLHSFRLFNDETGEEVTDTRLLTSTSDPNERFSELEYALFPLQRLAWNTAYRAELSYSSNQGDGTLAWAFRTRDPGGPLLTYAEDGGVITVPENYPEFTLYVPPEPGLDSVSGYSFVRPSDTSVEVDYLDSNTLSVRLDGAARGDQFNFLLNDGRRFSIRVEGSTAGANPAAQLARFDAASRLLTLPHVRLRGTSQALGATLALVNATPPVRFQLEDRVAADSASDPASYDSDSRVLTVPSVRVGGQDYRVEMTLVNSDFVFEIKSLERLP